MQLRTLSETIQRVREGVHFEKAIKEFMDAALMLTDNAGRAKLITEEPAFVGREFDADPEDIYNVLVAGIACELAHYSELTPPQWVSGSRRSLSEPFFTSPNREIQQIYLATTPAPYRQRNLFCGEILNQSLKIAAAQK